MLHPQQNSVNTEIKLMDKALDASRAATSPVEAETADLACGMSFDDWKELYSVSNTPGYSERYGEF